MAGKDREAQNSVQWFSGGWKVKEQREHRAVLGKQREHTKKIGYDSAALSTVDSGHPPGLSGQVL